ncbi:uncharacterized protein VTP21DRAFT_853 [Calcarisporiella thermophila]|uniref:uncharacterized protein n=1 Tax=Calcarisporiella thermophila TaxID=911321 RepID=UPI00374302E9
MAYLFKTLSLVGLGSSIPAFPYNIGDKVEWYEGESIWTLYHGTKREDGSPCSIFGFDCIRQRDKIPLAKNAFKKMRTMRHPDLLKYIDGVETENYIYIVTDPVEPLQDQLKQNPDSSLKLWGLYKISNALKFLNKDCGVCHGNIRISSIFTNKAGEWKLGGFELMSSMQEESPVILTYGGLVPESARYAAPEIAKGGWSGIKDHNISAYDAWQFACLIYEVYNGVFSSQDQLRAVGSIPSKMHGEYKALLNPSPRTRPDVTRFIDFGLRQNGYFQDNLIQVNLFLENLAMKDTKEKEAFYKKLDGIIDKLPSEICKYKILNELINAFEYGSGGAKVLGPIMKIGASLSDEEYEKTIVNSIVKMFASPDRAIRLGLLENLASFVDHLSNKTVNDKIYSHVATGFSDTVPLIREWTVKSILLLAPKLSDKNINYDLLRHMGKLQMDEEPGIRTNTTICLGKISKYMNDSTKKKVLIPGFTRGLRDPFPHARVASLMALSATCEYYDAADISSKIIPCISLALVDKEKIVRNQAFKAIDIFIKRAEKLAESMPETAEPDHGAANNQSSLQSNQSGVTSSTTLSSSAVDLAGWAVTSLTKKLAGGDDSLLATAAAVAIGSAAGTINGNGQEQLNSQISPVNGKFSRGIADLQPAPTQASTVTRSFTHLSAPPSNEGDGWGDDEDLFGFGDGAEGWEPMEDEPPFIEVPDISTLHVTSSTPSYTRNTSPLNNTSTTTTSTTKTSSAKASSGMKLPSKSVNAIPDGWDFEDDEMGGWEDTSPKPTTSSSTRLSKEERASMLQRKREERREKMAELREQKKKASGVVRK